MSLTLVDDVTIVAHWWKGILMREKVQGTWDELNLFVYSCFRQDRMFWGTLGGCFYLLTHFDRSACICLKRTRVWEEHEQDWSEPCFDHLASPLVFSVISSSS